MSGKSDKTSTPASADPVKFQEERWQITLTDHERMLLTAPDSLLSPLDSQERFLLRIALTPRQCPGCLSPICEYTAAKEHLDLRRAAGEHGFECPRCEAHLVWQVPFVGEPFFGLHPDEARPVKH
jgi:hypothetical protein